MRKLKNEATLGKSIKDMLTDAFKGIEQSQSDNFAWVEIDLAVFLKSSMASLTRTKSCVTKSKVIITFAFSF